MNEQLESMRNGIKKWVNRNEYNLEGFSMNKEECKSLCSLIVSEEKFNHLTLIAEEKRREEAKREII